MLFVFFSATIALKLVWKLIWTHTAAPPSYHAPPWWCRTAHARPPFRKEAARTARMRSRAASGSAHAHCMTTAARTTFPRCLSRAVASYGCRAGSGRLPWQRSLLLSRPACHPSRWMWPKGLDRVSLISLSNIIDDRFYRCPVTIVEAPLLGDGMGWWQPLFPVWGWHCGHHFMMRCLGEVFFRHIPVQRRLTCKRRNIKILWK